MDAMVGAWAATSLYWAEECRVQEKKPSEIFPDIGKWQHKWVPVEMPMVSLTTPCGGGRPAPPPQDADNRELVNRLDAVSGQVRRLQASADGEDNANRRAGGKGRQEWDVSDPGHGSKGRGSKAKAGVNGGKTQGPGGKKARRGGRGW